ncbi:TIR domain-containing protein [Rhodococcus sp. NPDC003348]
MTDGDLKVFTSWSGEFARDITRVIRNWLPQMLDRVDPWMSDVDIQAGTRALQVIEDKLNESEFGIIVVTTANQHSTWLNFEAGALSKRFEGRASRVVPVLVNFDSFYEIEGPIRQFQGVMLTKKPTADDGGPVAKRIVNKDGVRELLKAVSDVAGTKWPMVEARFEWSWSGFESKVNEVIERAGKQPTPPAVSVESLMAELLDRMTLLETGRETSISRLEGWPAHADRHKRERQLARAREARIMVDKTLTHYGLEGTAYSIRRSPDGSLTVLLSFPSGARKVVHDVASALEGYDFSVEWNYLPTAEDE